MPYVHIITAITNGPVLLQQAQMYLRLCTGHHHAQGQHCIAYHVYQTTTASRAHTIQAQEDEVSNLEADTPTTHDGLPCLEMVLTQFDVGCR